ncbi:MAG: STAS domain-containing protein [Gammaproteobacteria bacterium]|nr:STAS domain-containing protein [Gammaproteobacteria bacterium]
MPLTTSFSDNKDEVTIRITGHFDFGVHKAFRDAYESSPKSAHFVVELSAADSIDSSALGMLLLLREHAGNRSDRVILRGAGKSLLQVLANSKFDTLFTLD